MSTRWREVRTEKTSLASRISELAASMARQNCDQEEERVEGARAGPGTRKLGGGGGGGALGDGACSAGRH